MKACLGFDTSCYTTSVALCCIGDRAADGLFFQERRLLFVPDGARGLRQSEMVFQHVSRLPELTEALLRARPEARIAAIAASVRPRSAETSYMPAFRAGESAARTLAAALRVPFYETTHQEGHLRAARVGTALDADKPFLALHLSGGTTEVLRADGGRAELLGGALDLHAGQLIDRVGVAMGLSFPAGPRLERLALSGKAKGAVTASVRGLSCHFSGAEAQALRLLEAGETSKEDIAADVFACVARTVARLVVEGCEQTGLLDALLGGGVASSSLIRAQVTERVLKRSRNLRLHFARPDLSGDNAVGVALIGAARLTNEKEEGAWRLS